MHLYCMSTNQIWHLESTLLYHIETRDRWFKWTSQTYPKKKPLLIVSNHTKRAIRSTSIIIHFRIIFKKKDEKNVTDSYKFTSLVCELKKEDLVLEAQINFPYENFPDMPAERKRPRSTLLFIDTSTSFGGKRKKQR